jgi:hypothetical protein
MNGLATCQYRIIAPADVLPNTNLYIMIMSCTTAMAFLGMILVAPTTVGQILVSPHVGVHEGEFCNRVPGLPWTLQHSKRLYIGISKTPTFFNNMGMLLRSWAVLIPSIVLADQHGESAYTRTPWFKLSPFGAMWRAFKLVFSTCL